MSNSLITLRSVVAPRSSALTHALFIVGGTSFIALMAQISIPVPGSPVPVTGQTLAVLLVGTTYGARLGAATFSTYISLLAVPTELIECLAQLVDIYLECF